MARVKCSDCAVGAISALLAVVEAQFGVEILNDRSIPNKSAVSMTTKNFVQLQWHR